MEVWFTRIMGLEISWERWRKCVRRVQLLHELLLLELLLHGLLLHACCCMHGSLLVWLLFQDVSDARAFLRVRRGGGAGGAGWLV